MESPTWVDFCSARILIRNSISEPTRFPVNFRFDYWRPNKDDPNAKYYFAIVAEREAYRLSTWRNRELEGFLQIVRKD